MTAFDQAMVIILASEGGYSNNSADPGGETNFGISKRAFPSVDIAQLTVEGAKAIYKASYWDKTAGGLDNVDPGLALILMDAAVNNGVGAANKFLQSALGVAEDGVIGPQTLAALRRADPQEILVAAHGARINMMAGLSTWKTFGKGWSKRLAHLPYQAAQMQSDAPAASVDQPPAG